MTPKEEDEMAKGLALTKLTSVIQEAIKTAETLERAAGMERARGRNPEQLETKAHFARLTVKGLRMLFNDVTVNIQPTADEFNWQMDFTPFDPEIDWDIDWNK